MFKTRYAILDPDWPGATSNRFTAALRFWLIDNATVAVASGKNGSAMELIVFIGIKQRVNRDSIGNDFSALISESIWTCCEHGIARRCSSGRALKEKLNSYPITPTARRNIAPWLSGLRERRAIRSTATFSNPAWPTRSLERDESRRGTGPRSCHSRRLAKIGTTEGFGRI